jgi:endonuclease/exonuclease/phosphatase family metal-dependent hydrolase
MTWNIAEGSGDRLGEENSAIPLIAQRIREQQPDIVLLNEVVNWAGWPWGSGMHQVRELVRLTRLPHAHWAHTVPLGVRGHKAVAVLSRFPLGSAKYIVVPMPPLGTSGYGMLHTTTKLGGVIYHLISLRFDAHNTAARRMGISALGHTVMEWPTEPCIVGGDFNCAYDTGPKHEPLLRTLTVDPDNAGNPPPLRDAFLERPDQERCDPDSQIIDHIMFRGDLTVEKTKVRCDQPNPSDHVWVVADFVIRDTTPDVHLPNWVGGWSQLYSSGDNLTSLKVARNADGRLEVFGINQHQNIWHTWQTAPNGKWVGGWSQLYRGSDTLVALDVAANADGRLEVVGINQHQNIWHTWQTAPNGKWVGGWSQLYSSGDNLTSLKVARNADGRLEVFGINQHQNIWHTWQTAPNGKWVGGWSQLYSSGDNLTSLKVARNADGRLEVFGINQHQNIWHTWQLKGA